MSATAASATEIVVDFHEKNGQPPPPPVNETSEFKSSNTTNNLWLNFFSSPFYYQLSEITLLLSDYN